MLVNEIFSRQWRDRKAVARYAGLTGSPDESGSRRRERGLARAGNVRVRSAPYKARGSHCRKCNLVT
jgi:transposase